MVTPRSRQEIGARVENFRLEAIHGDDVSLEALLQGKQGAVVVFWSSVCSHCVRYDGYLESFQHRHPTFALAAVASRENEAMERIRAAAAQRHLTFPILHDSDGEVAKQWFAQQTPRAYLVDSQRILHFRGAIDNYKYPDDPEYVPYLEPALRQLLAGEILTRTESASFGCAIESVYYKLPKAL